MKLKKANLFDLLETGNKGEVCFNERRALIFDVDLLRDLRLKLVEKHGVTAASKMIWSFSYANGFRDAGIVKADYDKKSRGEWLDAGAELMRLRGWANAVVLSSEFEAEKEDAQNYLQIEWNNSWEVGGDNSGHKPESWQACWAASGYLSGFASAIAGKNVFVIETECHGRGDEKCRAIAKSDWTNSDELTQQILERIDLDASENFNLGEVLAEVTPITDQIRRLIAQLEVRDAEIQNLQMQVHYLQESTGENPIEEMIGKSAAYKKALKEARTVAVSSDTTVLIEGETGTGKELFARYIHRQSPLASRPLITVNCAALPASLVESELFGHEKGAFTGAVQRKLGRFEIADGGTIFLDEIGELPLETQAKFLRVLQEGEFERLGGTQTIKVKVRVIAATNRNLEELVADGKFRSDLYFRLNVFPVSLPPLRERASDIPLLTDFYTQKFRRNFNKPITALSQTSINGLKNYAFPGNIRELRHLVERAVLLSQNSTLEIDLPLQKNALSIDSINSGGRLKTLEAMERDYIEVVLQRTRGVVAGKGGAAEILGLPSSTLRSRMKKLGIK